VRANRYGSRCNRQRRGGYRDSTTTQAVLKALIPSLLKQVEISLPQMQLLSRIKIATHKAPNPHRETSNAGQVYAYSAFHATTLTSRRIQLTTPNFKFHFYLQRGGLREPTPLEHYAQVNERLNPKTNLFPSSTISNLASIYDSAYKYTFIQKMVHTTLPGVSSQPSSSSAHHTAPWLMHIGRDASAR
jgi:hypothetical protein